MILVTTGTNAPAFDRLLRAVDELALEESVVVQHGPSVLRPANAVCVDYVSFDRFVELVKEARVVVTHAGVGSILTTLMNGKRPVVVPRLARYAEHVDDHQLELSRRLAEIDVITLVEDPAHLSAVIESDSELRSLVRPGAGGGLVDDLGAYLRTVVNGARWTPAPT
jgi:UDP-N-acetylglucosamine transferase subunit ALG13